MAGTPSPDGHHDDLEADELEGLALLVPDDPRSLESDRLAYLREQRAERAGRLRRHLSPGGTGGGLLGTGLAGPAILVLLVVVGLVGSTLSVFGGSTTPTYTLQPLASDTAVPAGQLHGLLPDVQVTVSGRLVDLRRARPAVLAMVPTTCGTDCTEVVRSMRAQAAEYGLTFALTGPRAQQQQLEALARDALADAAQVAVDDTDAVRSAYDPSGVTLVLVHSDGIVAAVVRDIQQGQHLESAMVQLASPGAPSA